MPQLQQLWESYEGKGLNIFHVESQGTPADKLEGWLAKHGATFPNTTDRGAFSGFPSPGGLPYAFVVGVDGKVIWEGRRGYKSIISEEMKKVRYAGLGKATVAEGLEKAGSLFGQKQYAKASKEASKKLEEAKESGNTALEADAQYIIERTEKMAEKLMARVERFKSEREYSRAMNTLTLMKASFKGTAHAEKASIDLKSLKSDKAVKQELKADAAFEKFLATKYKKARNPEEQKEMLKAFAAGFEGRKAAERALQMAEYL